MSRNAVTVHISKVSIQVDSPILASLKQYLRKRPLILGRFDRALCCDIAMEPSRLRHLTVTWNSGVISGLKIPTLCLIELAPDPLRDDVTPRSQNSSSACYLGIIDHRSKVASFQTRLKFATLAATRFAKLTEIARQPSYTM